MIYEMYLAMGKKEIVSTATQSHLPMHAADQK